MRPMSLRKVTIATSTFARAALLSFGWSESRLHRTKFERMSPVRRPAVALPSSGKRRSQYWIPQKSLRPLFTQLFVNYPKGHNPDRRSLSRIRPEECSHLTAVIARELEANGFMILREAA